jgi:hypothetical protein
MNAFEIKDPNIATDEIRQLVAERVRQRQAYAQDQAIDFEAMAQSLSLKAQSQAAIPWMLHALTSRQASILVAPYTVPSEQRFPGQMWAWAKQQIHNLVIYYVNRLGKKQISFNESATWAIMLQQARLENLQATVTILEQKIQALEAQLAPPESKIRD